MMINARTCYLILKKMFQCVNVKPLAVHYETFEESFCG